MGRNAKLGAVAVVVLIVAALVYRSGAVIPALGILLIGMVAIFVLLRQESDDTDDDDGPVKTRDPKAKKGKARLDEILDDKAAKSGGPTARNSPSTRPTSRPAPNVGLPTWSPGSVDAGASTADDVAPVDEGTENNWDTWEKEWPQGEATDTLAHDDDDDPLGALDRLDDIDPVAEVERIEASETVVEDPFASLRTSDTFELDDLDELEEFEVDLADDPAPRASSGSSFSFATAPPVINEEVSTADDIMAASEATELHVEEAGDSELARLLAKVQARLSAYE